MSDGAPKEEPEKGTEEAEAARRPGGAGPDSADAPTPEEDGAAAAPPEAEAPAEDGDPDADADAGARGEEPSNAPSPEDATADEPGKGEVAERRGEQGVDEDAIPPAMIESSTSLVDAEKETTDDDAVAHEEEESRGEKRPATGEAAPPTPPSPQKAPAPKGDLPAGAAAAKAPPPAGKAKPRRAQRQKQRQRVAGPAGAGGGAPVGAAGGGAQPRRVQQRRPQGQRGAGAAGAGAGAGAGGARQAPQQRVVLSVPTWLGSTLSTYAGSVNRRTAMTLLGVTAVVGASIGSVIALQNGGGEADTGVRGSAGARSYGGGMAARTSASDYSNATSSSSSSTAAGAVPLNAAEVLNLDGSPPPISTVLPAAFDSYADFDSPRSDGEVPFFLHVPRSGGLTMMEILAKCLDLVIAGGETGVRGGHANDKELLVIETPSGSYINCDPTTPTGIDHCLSLDLVGSGKADVVSSPLPYESSSLFSPPRRGRMFALLRPVADRAISHFRWIRTSGTDPEIPPDMALDRYARLPTDRPEFNWLTKSLAGKPGTTTDVLTASDLDVAKEVLRRKVDVGLLSQKGDSMLRFERRFGWDGALAASPEREQCVMTTLHWEWKGKAGDGAVSSHGGMLWSPGADLRAELERRNAFDVELYRYAERLFEERRAAFQSETENPYEQQQQQQQPSLEASPAVPLSNDVKAMTNSASAESSLLASPTSGAPSGICRAELFLSAALAALAAMEI